MTSCVSTMPAVKGGRKRPIVHVGKTRHPEFPDVSAVGEILDEKIAAHADHGRDHGVTRGFFGPEHGSASRDRDARRDRQGRQRSELVAEANKRGAAVHFYSGDSEQARIRKRWTAGRTLPPILKAAAQSIK